MRSTNKEEPMSLSNTRHARIAAVAVFWLSVSLAPAFAAGGGGVSVPRSSPPPPPTNNQMNPGKSVHSGKSSQQKKRKQDQRSESDYREFAIGYNAARALVLDGKYTDAIIAFRALGYDDNPDVANYVGYAYRKLGDYDQSKVWYDKALASDPNHVRTWEYYGLWHLEQGNKLKAQDFLENIRLLCGNTDCQEYVDLKVAIEDGRYSY
jgi:tetratricopeptide (TPR) repeat protein